MGQEQKGTIDQSGTKPKNWKNQYSRRETTFTWWRFGLSNAEKSTYFALPVDVVNFMKEMNLHQVANFILEKNQMNALKPKGKLLIYSFCFFGSKTTLSFDVSNVSLQLVCKFSW